jgi:hypothetical protein
MKGNDLMADVNIQPLADWMRRTKCRPCHPPIFGNGEPTAADVSLALALIEALDAESREWYAQSAKRLRARHTA